VINIKAIRKVYLVLLILTIIESGSQRVFILKVALVLYKNPLTNRLIRRIYLSNIKKIFPNNTLYTNAFFNNILVMSIRVKTI
jgi:hypothetical protein